MAKGEDPRGANGNDEVYNEYMKNIYFHKNFEALGKRFEALEGNCDKEIKRLKQMFLGVLEALAEKLNDQLLLGKDGEMGSAPGKGKGGKGSGLDYDYEAPSIDKARFLNGIRDRVADLHAEMDNL